MPRLTLFALLALLVAAPALAQPLALRLDDREVDRDGVSLASLSRGLHVIAPGASEPVEVVLFSAVVVDGEVLATARAPFLAMPASGAVSGGSTLSRSGLRPDGHYLLRRKRTTLSVDVLSPPLPGLRVGGRQFPGDMFFPGDMYQPGATYTATDRFGTDAERVVARLGQRFIGGVVRVPGEIAITGTGVGFSLGAAQPGVLRAAGEIGGRDARDGEPMLVLFAARPGQDTPSEVVGFVRAR